MQVIWVCAKASLGQANMQDLCSKQERHWQPQTWGTWWTIRLLWTSFFLIKLEKVRQNNLQKRQTKGQRSMLSHQQLQNGEECDACRGSLEAICARIQATPSSKSAQRPWKLLHNWLKSQHWNRPWFHKHFWPFTVWKVPDYKILSNNSARQLSHLVIDPKLQNTQFCIVGPDWLERGVKPFSNAWNLPQMHGDGLKQGALKQT